MSIYDRRLAPCRNERISHYHSNICIIVFAYCRGGSPSLNLYMVIYNIPISPTCKIIKTTMPWL